LRSFFAEIGTINPQVTSTWTSQTLTNDFTYENTIPTSPSAIFFTSSYASTFSNNFTVPADTDIIVSSTFAGQLAGHVDYWAQTLEVEPVSAPAPPVPGPLPLFGAATAFGWSRKIRKQIKQSQTLEYLE
jgi:hypothetical protein